MLIVAQLVKKYAVFLGAQRFVTIFKEPPLIRNVDLLDHIYITHSCSLCIGLPINLVLSGFQTKILYAFLA